MGETRDLTDEDPVTHEPRKRPRVVSKVFANEDFGYRKITVERPLRLNFAATTERIVRIEEQGAFQKFAKSRKRPGPAHDAEIAERRARQDAIRDLLSVLGEETGGEVMRDREVFRAALQDASRAAGLRLKAGERKAIESALGERDPKAAGCCNRRGEPEPDPELRDTETVPLREDIDDYMAREVLPHVPGAWVDHNKTKVGYEIPLNRHFYVYEAAAPAGSDQGRPARAGARDRRAALRGHGLNRPCARYRDSGVEWLGDMPEHWEMKRLRFVASTNDEKLSDTEEPLRPISYVDIGSVDSTHGILQTEGMVFEDAPSPSASASSERGHDRVHG